MIGDSQTLVFSHLLFEAEFQGQKRQIITEAKYCPGLAAHNFSDPRGRLHETLLRALMGDCLLDRENRALYQFQSPQAGLLNLLAGRSKASPVLVFFCGSADLVNVFQRHLGLENDFYLPDQETLLAAFPESSAQQVFPFETARLYLQDLIQPLYRGLKKLQEMGFDQIYLHDLVPQTSDDHEFSLIYQYQCPARTRIKAQLLMNQLLREMAQALGIRFLEIWPKVTHQNRRIESFALDSIHLNKQAAFLSFETLWNEMCSALNAQYQPEPADFPDLIETVNELAILWSQWAHTQKYSKILEDALQRADLFKLIARRQVEWEAQLESFVTVLHALVQAHYARGDLTQISTLLTQYAALVRFHRPLARPESLPALKLQKSIGEEVVLPARFDPAQTDLIFWATLQGIPIRIQPRGSA
ncbi:hypothetical protein COW36_08340 [bacterium (Candidatus Blackallbacteria) CG17_big_fil_post_rev_8_21_14_2_50_48_46]|uniref:Uncharacterized protein n=1 Tax=bacterium (Candidatus Blackallbacteria) CG17_big_fil_post_rev_8_21_14_2_50_48_46 TaxID=2014261 RepID=A0A2M7G6C9_9BACT|nr:MAG: hypothetical protein COW64_24880 [bacterium (Candidatus Blackallbacteria) CG18_big_fil_WC_8_21_14_2_50_49_26]PIW17499.1 MAG: hypothetical protein COW36_08340 [bacterium (Candidatus Blackallbacteria) CG17_big_fil_post_rev_8_21_14_2_50_48_46]PIW48353.1 MAG: hypothetical protein COW20_09695 [bacterium (Candidatus Blackallbacteria) CG13_big_fil_rev_8_21_14_2_50_49_14]